MSEEQFWIDEMRAREQVARYEAYTAHVQTLWNLAVEQYCAALSMQWAAALRDSAPNTRAADEVDASQNTDKAHSTD